MKPVDFPGTNVVFAKEQPEYIPLPRNENTGRPARANNNKVGIIPGRIEADTGNRDNSFIRTNV